MVNGQWLMVNDANQELNMNIEIAKSLRVGCKKFEVYFSKIRSKNGIPLGMHRSVENATTRFFGIPNGMRV